MFRFAFNFALDDEYKSNGSTDPVETEEVESAKKTTTDTGNDQTTTAGKNDNDTTAQKEVSGTDPLTSKNSTE